MFLVYEQRIYLLLREMFAIGSYQPPKSRWRMSHPTVNAPHISRAAVFGARRFFFLVTGCKGHKIINFTIVAAGSNMYVKQASIVKCQLLVVADRERIY